MGCGDPEGWSSLLRSQQPSSQAMRQPESPAAAHAPVALSWPKVEEVRARRVRRGGGGCSPSVLPLVLVPGLLSQAQQPVLVPEQHMGSVSAGCPLGGPCLTHTVGSHPQGLVLLQLWAHLDVLLVASWQELTQHICAFTRALAQRPLKCVPPTRTRGCGWGRGQGHPGGWDLSGVFGSRARRGLCELGGQGAPKT